MSISYITFNEQLHKAEIVWIFQITKSDPKVNRKKEEITKRNQKVFHLRGGKPNYLLIVKLFIYGDSLRSLNVPKHC